MQDSNFIEYLNEVAIAAGDIIMKHYKGDYDIEIKADSSPVTEADIAADRFISKKIREISNIPIISEEGDNKLSPEITQYFLVDPLDGTKSFIAKTGEFTVNIGLIENGRPVWGVIYQPTEQELFYTNNGKCYFKKGEAEAVEIKCNGKPERGEFKVIASKSHLSKETENYIADIKVSEFIKAGSSLKFCKLAQGKADLYPRFSPTMQWDTAAGQAILEAAGGSVTNEMGDIFSYHLTDNKADLKNGNFIAKGWN